jgi:hypothetical protein
MTKLNKVCNRKSKKIYGKEQRCKHNGRVNILAIQRRIEKRNIEKI